MRTAASRSSRFLSKRESFCTSTNTGMGHNPPPANPPTLAAWSRILNYPNAEVGVFLLANRMRLLRPEWTRADIDTAILVVQDILEKYSTSDSEDLVKEFSESYSESDFGEYDSLDTSASSSSSSA